MPITDLIPWRKKEPVQREQERELQRAEHPVLIFQQEMNRLFNNFFGRSALEPFGVFHQEWDMFSPRVDVSETDKEIVVSAELPGLDESDINLSLSHVRFTHLDWIVDRNSAACTIPTSVRVIFASCRFLPPEFMMFWAV